MLELKENIHMYTYKTKADGSGYNINLPVFLNGKEALEDNTEEWSFTDWHKNNLKYV